MKTKTQPETIQFLTELRKFQPFYGANHTLIQRLLTGKDQTGIQVDVPRSIISPKRLMELRLGYVGNEIDKVEFREEYIDTNLAVLPDPNSDEVTFSHRHPLICTLNEKTRLVERNLNEKTRLVERNLKIDGDVYAEAKKNGFIIKAPDAKILRNKPYNLPHLRREVWEFFTEGDTAITDAYVADVTETVGLGFNEVMDLYLPSTKGLRLLSVSAVEDSGRSDAGGYGSLGNDDGHLVGEALEVQFIENFLDIRLEVRVQSALEAGKGFDYNGVFYEPRK